MTHARIKVGDRVRRKTDQYSGPWGGRLGLVTGTYNHVGADVVVRLDDDDFPMAMSSRDLELMDESAEFDYQLDVLGEDS